MSSMFSRSIQCLVLAAALISQAASVAARDLNASLAFIPSQSEKDPNGNFHGGFAELVKALDRSYTEGKISMDIHPFSRSLKMVELGEADFHIPLIRLPHIPGDSLPYAYASEPLTKVSFVLYTQADKPPLSAQDLNNKKNLIETVRGHKHFFQFDIIESDGIDQSIKRLNSGIIDGFIMEQEAVDRHIKALKLKNIRRTLYATWDSCVVIPKGPRGKEIDAIISTQLRKLKDTGELQKIMQTVHLPYDNWQPYQSQ